MQIKVLCINTSTVLSKKNIDNLLQQLDDCGELNNKNVTLSNMYQQIFTNIQFKKVTKNGTF